VGLACPGIVGKALLASKGTALGAALDLASMATAGCDAESEAAGSTLNDEMSFPACSGVGTCRPGHLQMAMYSTLSPA
jgi:hypothetical protein